MAWHDFLVALCLVFVFEGVLPFLKPQSWRKMVYRMAQLDDRSMRMMGLLSMLMGITVLALVK